MQNFEKLGIRKEFIKGLNELGIQQPTEIQKEAIPVLTENSIHFIGHAPTGTGKTAAFGLPLLQKIDTSSKRVQGVILAPTRELCQQINKQLFKFTKHSERIFTEGIYGGAPIDRQIANLKRPTHIIVATPGRLLDLIKQKHVDLTSVKTIILDEADEMLSMGFRAEMDAIIESCPAAGSRWIFSATIPSGMKKLIDRHLRKDAVYYKVQAKSGANKKIDHQFVVLDEREKFDIAMQFIKSAGKERGIVFCRTKKSAQLLAKQLKARNINADSLHGDLKQLERDKVMRAFRNKSLQVLVATDVAARGIDIEKLAYVLNYELPGKDEYYVHRSGRTGRAGEYGNSVCLVTSKEVKQIRALEKKLGVSFSQMRGRM